MSSGQTTCYDLPAIFSKEEELMLENRAVIAFVATRDAARARAFYQDVLGLPLVADEPYALVFDAHGTMLRVARVDELTPARHTVLGWRVPDIVDAVTALRERGVTASSAIPGCRRTRSASARFPARPRSRGSRIPTGTRCRSPSWSTTPRCDSVERRRGRRRARVRPSSSAR